MNDSGNTHEGSDAPERHRISRRIVSTAAWAPAALMAAMLLWLSGQPLATPDMWWHLKAGEMYWQEGLYPKEDPMLFTAGESGPVQHEWLFGTALYLAGKAVGLQGLRGVHVMLVGAALLLSFRLLRAADRSLFFVPAGLGVWIVLSWKRLIQLRPDLISISAAFLIFSWVVWPRRGPDWRRLTAAAALMVVWTNAHSLASIAMALTAAALLGALFQWRLEHSLEAGSADGGAAGRRRAVTLAAGLACMTAASLLHPRGFDQVITFFISSSETAVWGIRDEWHAFNPFYPYPPYNSPSLPFLTWLVADLVIAGFCVAGFAGMRGYRRRPTAESLDRLNPVLFMVGAASAGAMLISVRFLWMGIFPLLYVLQAVSGTRGPLTSKGRPPLSAAFASIVLLVLYPGAGGWELFASIVPSDPKVYAATTVNRDLFTHEGMRFLKETGVKGRLFNPYMLGGYLGYHLAPDLRTFIDGRTEHYPPERAVEYRIVTLGGAGENGQLSLDLLDTHQVDFFYGVGGPGYPYVITGTWGRLDGVPGWIPVFRSSGVVIYMRLGVRNRINMRRIEEYYAGHRLPFDPLTGVDTAAILEHRSDWAIERKLVPPRYNEVRRAAMTPGPEKSRAALDLAAMHYEAGDFGGAADFGRMSAGAADTMRRGAAVTVRSLLRTARIAEALSFVAELKTAYPDDDFLNSLEAEVKGFAAAVTGERGAPSRGADH